jgi:RNA polymerase sigma-70 factor (ECF subfamily)
MNISHSETEDLVQDVLVKIWNKLPDFNYNPDKAKFRTWLSTVIKNTVLNHLESSKSHANKIDKATQEPIKGYSEHEIDSLMRKEWENYITNMAMGRIKKSFPGQAIKVFEMTLEGKSIADIASLLEIKENSVYKSKNRVKARLIEEIANLRLELE